MRILIAGRREGLGGALVTALAHRHDVRMLEHGGGDPRQPDAAAEAAQEFETIVLAPPFVGPDAPDGEILDAAARGTYNLLTQAPAARFILLSSLRTLERYPSDYRVSEQWAPRPSADVKSLAPHLAELVARELSRVRPVQAIALRLGEVVDDRHASRRPPDASWLHIEDAVQAVERALAFEPPADGPQTGWWVFHIPGGGRKTRFPLALAGSPLFGYRPQHDLSAGAKLPPSQPPIGTHKGRDAKAAYRPQRVVIYGAGGPVAAVTTEALARDHILRLTDLRPLAEIIAENRPPTPGRPSPRLLGPPHEIACVDVTDAEKVLQAARGMDAMINCTVVRDQPEQAFQVNVVGVYNMLRAAVACEIRRFVQTGPPQGCTPIYSDPTNYGYDYDISAEAPARPGNDLYNLTKFLGQEICRIFADVHGIETPVLTFAGLVDPQGPGHDAERPHAWLTAWEDVGSAMRQALTVPSFPRNFEVMQICSDTPHGRFSNEKARRLLAWEPRHRMERYWLRSHGPAG